MKTKTKVIVILVIALIFFGTAFYRDFLLRCKYFNTSIEGKVTDIRFDSKKLAVVRMNDNDQWIYLGTDIRYEISINIGDSIYKIERNYNPILVKEGKKYDIGSKRVLSRFLKYCKCN